MFEKLLQLRFVFLIAVIVTLINSFFFLYLGLRHAYHGYEIVFGAVQEKNPGLAFVESIDMFMIAFVFLIFSLGIMRIFTHYHVSDENLPNWLRINSFKELKVLLWETILMTLVILSLSLLVRNLSNLTWDILIVPSMTFILAISLYAMQRTNGH